MISWPAPRLVVAVGALALLLVGVSRPASANCLDPSDESALVSQMLSTSALSPSVPHPILQRTIVASGNQIYARELGTLAAIGSPLTLSATVEGTPNTVGMNDGRYASFVVQQDGNVARINPAGASPTLDWQTDLRRTGCTEDSLSATPMIHLRRYASESFQARYARDVVYVATRYDQDCFSGNTANRVYALDADTGAALWVFNEDASVSMDVAHAAPYLDYLDDQLVIGTDRSGGSDQHSLWSIDAITGTRSWSTNVGPMYASPIVQGTRIYAATLSGEIKALSKADGATLWSVNNGGIPILSNIFREFRAPYGELIAAVDYAGDVWLVRDDGDFGSTAWTASLVDPVTGFGALATSRVSIDPGYGKLYVGANDGQIYQLNLVDGSVEATRTVSAGSAVGDASFVFEGGDVNMVAGSASGVLAKFCAPWTAEALLSPLQPNCTSDDQCDPDNPNPTPCSAWSCVSGVCVASPSPDGQSCTGDGNALTFNDECNAGICLGYSDCQQDAGACSCTEASGAVVTRALQVTQESCSTAPPSGSGIDPTNWCGQEVSALVTQSDCLEHGTGAQTAVWVHLFDQNRRPFAITSATGSVEITLSGGAGTPPLFLSPTTFAPLSGTSASLSAGTLVASSEREGTYFAYLGAQDASAQPSGSTPWTLELNVTLTSGSTCIDTAADSQLLSVPITMGHTETQSCSLDGGASSGYLQVTVNEGGGSAHADAPVQVGYASNLRFAQSFEENLRGAPTGASTGLTDAEGKAEFIDFGRYLSGPLPVSATCPGGVIGDDDTVTVQTSSQSVEIALSCSPPTTPGHITYLEGGSLRRIEATEGASAIDLGALLDLLGSGGDGYPAVSRNGEWMTVVTSRFGCASWSCLAIINSDFSSYELPSIPGSGILHPDSRVAISDDGNTLVYADSGSNARDLYLVRKSAGTWSSPLLLTSDSAHAFNKLPVLSYDESRVLFDCGPTPYGEAGTGLCEVGVDGAGFVQIVDPDDNPLGGGSGFAVHHGDYAPDGSYVFESDWASEQIWRQASALATPVQIIEAHSNDNSPCVLPSGVIASLWLPNGGHEIKLTSADGSSYSLITPGVDIADVGMSCHD